MGNLQKYIAEPKPFLRFCGLIVACAAAFAAILDMFDAYHLARLPFEMNYEEGNILNAGLRIAHGLSPYPNPHAFPNVLNPYGPVFYYLIAIPVRLVGPGFTLPRAIVLLSTVAVALFIALLIHEFTRSPILGVAAGCLFIASPLLYFWMPLLRVDLLGLALTFAGLYLFARKLWRWAALFFVLAIFTKISFLAAPAACLTFLLSRGETRRAAGFAALGAAGVLLGFAIAQLLTHGWFAFHILHTHNDPFSWRLVWWSLAGMAKLDLPLILLSILFVVFRVRNSETRLLAIYLIFALVGTVTIGKLGSDSNHLLEFHAALSLCAVLGLEAIAERVTLRWATVAALAAGTILLVFFTEKNPRIVNERAMLRDCPHVYGFVERTGGDVLADNVGMLVLTGKPVFVSNPFVLRYLSDQWDKPLQQKIAAQGFSAIVLSGDPLNINVNASERWSAQVLKQIKGNYREGGHFQCTEANTVLIPAGHSTGD